jgi:hypothetical protein
VDAEDVGEGPRAKGVDESNVGVDTEDIREAPHVKVLAMSSPKILMKIFFNVDVREAL